MARKSAYIITASSDLETYHFTSTSTERTIEKRIEFQNLNYEFEGRQLYNLAFGDINENGEINDEAQSNNGDIIKIMSTIFSAIYEFTARYPERCVYFTGSDEQRTNFYQQIIRRKHEELIAHFSIYGEMILNENESDYEEFDLTRDYHGFMVVRKLNEE